MAFAIVGTLVGAAAVWAAWQTYRKQPVVPPKIAAAARAAGTNVSTAALSAVQKVKGAFA